MQAVSPYIRPSATRRPILCIRAISDEPSATQFWHCVLGRPNLESIVLDGNLPPGKNSNPNLGGAVLTEVISPGTLIHSWVTDNAWFIRSIDPNHMARSPSHQTRLRAAHSCPDSLTSDPCSAELLALGEMHRRSCGVLTCGRQQQTCARKGPGVYERGTPASDSHAVCRSASATPATLRTPRPRRMRSRRA